MPLSTEPNTFGQARDIMEEERWRQVKLFKKKKKKVIIKTPSYRKELRAFLKTMKVQYHQEYNYKKNTKIPYLNDPHFRRWVLTTKDYKSFRVKMLNLGVKGVKMQDGHSNSNSREK